MKLIIFDIDGTLTDTNEADHKCFVEAVAKGLGLEGDIPEELINNLKLETDTAAAFELWDHYKARFPKTYELNQVKSELVTAFDHHHKNNSAILEIQGAKELFEKLKQRDDICLAIATGSWKASAEYKLDIVDIRWRYIPFITAEKFRNKFEILKECRNHSRVFYGQGGFDKEIYVGDKDWDEEAAKRLGMGFIRIDKNAESNSFNCLNKYPNIDEFLSIVNKLS